MHPTPHGYPSAIFQVGRANGNLLPRAVSARPRVPEILSGLRDGAPRCRVSRCGPESGRGSGAQALANVRRKRFSCPALISSVRLPLGRLWLTGDGRDARAQSARFCRFRAPPGRLERRCTGGERRCGHRARRWSAHSVRSRSADSGAGVRGSATQPRRNQGRHPKQRPALHRRGSAAGPLPPWRPKQGSERARTPRPAAPSGTADGLAFNIKRGSQKSGNLLFY